MPLTMAAKEASKSTDILEHGKQERYDFLQTNIIPGETCEGIAHKSPTLRSQEGRFAPWSP
jgi:hypothetical protein